MQAKVTVVTTQLDAIIGEFVFEIWGNDNTLLRSELILVHRGKLSCVTLTYRSCSAEPEHV